MTKLTPTRTVSATRLITVTTTYETELTQDAFLALTPNETHVIRLFGQNYQLNLDSLAMEILCEHGSDFRALSNAVPDNSSDLRAILTIVNAFDYQRFGKLMLSQYSNETGYTLLDGNHRSVALALLLKSEQLEYQPVTAMFTEIQQSVSEPILDTGAMAQTITAAQKGMHHYPVKRK